MTSSMFSSNRRTNSRDYYDQRPQDNAAYPDVEAASVSDGSSTTDAESWQLATGTLSAQGLLRLGEGVLRVAGRLQRTLEMNQIDTIMKRDPREWPPSVMQHLLEMQRAGYQDSMRRAAWDRILIAMERAGWQHIVNELEQWEHEDIIPARLFIRQLAACRHTGWTTHPLRRNIMPPQGVARTPSGSASEARGKALTASLAHILRAFFIKPAFKIHQSFDLENMAALLADGTLQHEGPHFALSMFFNSFAALNPLPDRIRADALIIYLNKNASKYLAVHCLIDYVLTSPPEVYDKYLQALITHILYAIRPFAYKTAQQDQTQIVLNLHPYLKSPQIIHPTWPFLCFALFLTSQSADATRKLIDADIIHILEELSLNSRSKSLPFMFLWLLTTMSQWVDLSNCAFKLRLERWIEDHTRRKEARATGSYIPDGPPPEYRPSSAGSGSHRPPAPGRGRTQTAPPPQQPPRTQVRPPSNSVSSTASSSSGRSMSTFPAEQIYSAEHAQQEPPPPPGRVHILADALAFANQAVDLDSQGHTQSAVALYAISAALLVGAVKLSIEGGRVSRRARRIKEFYEAYVSRIHTLCAANHLPVPHIELLPALPRSPALAPTSLPTINEGRTQGAPSNRWSMGSVETMRERNNELLSLWQSTMRGPS